MFDLTGKIALVTGGSRGIGRGVAVALASRGAHVVVNYMRNEAAAAETVGLITAAGGKGETAKFDVANPAATEQGVSAAAKQHGRLDILVACAGISIDSLLLRLKDEDFDQTLAVNLRGAVACARAAIRPMLKTKGGRIVFVSSVVGEMGNSGQTAYAASKAALLGVTKSLALEYASRNITVNAVTPGYVDTDMTRSLSDEARSHLLSQVPLARPATTAEVGAAVVYLVSDEASYVTGHALRVNGGMYM
ncbi:MAG: 3-oxoacyl-ACP reductase FabG [Polyangiaceae bacterium]|nr:3-oxoacyl-ACP reductase FabG [Polyangiaceae bacterium]